MFQKINVSNYFNVLESVKGSKHFLNLFFNHESYFCLLLLPKCLDELSLNMVSCFEGRKKKVRKKFIR
jgi:hypothetical protein